MISGIDAVDRALIEVQQQLRELQLQLDACAIKITGKTRVAEARKELLLALKQDG